MKANPVIVEQLFDATPSEVWRAITEIELIRQWYFDLPDFKAEIGFQFSFIGGPSPEKQYLHLCEITEVVKEKKLTYSWRYDGYEGNSFVAWELFPQDNGTLLRVTHTGLDTFPIANTDFAAHNFAEGWTHILKISLKDFISKTF